MRGIYPEHYFCTNLKDMEAKRTTGKYWVYFFLWLTLMIIMLVLPDARPFFWLALPGTCTHFAMAMNIM